MLSVDHTKGPQRRMLRLGKTNRKDVEGNGRGLIYETLFRHIPGENGETTKILPGIGTRFEPANSGIRHKRVSHSTATAGITA
jgi:hypothetical protein